LSCHSIIGGRMDGLEDYPGWPELPASVRHHLENT
jgi:hypothetical protein